MPAWIHNRADRILRKNPNMDEGEAFAIATQQAHALGKSPKGYGTSEGRAEARRKYRTPQDDQKTASAFMWNAFFSEVEKLADIMGKALGTAVKARPLAIKPFTPPKTVGNAALGEFRRAGGAGRGTAIIGSKPFTAQTGPVQATAALPVTAATTSSPTRMAAPSTSGMRPA